MKESYKALATRSINAYNWLIEMIAESGEMYHEDAQKVADFYRQEKLVKLDVQQSRYKFKNGALLDKDTIYRALEIINEKDIEWEEK